MIDRCITGQHKMNRLFADNLYYVKLFFSKAVSVINLHTMLHLYYFLKFEKVFGSDQKKRIAKLDNPSSISISYFYLPRKVLSFSLMALYFSRISS